MPSRPVEVLVAVCRVTGATGATPYARNCTVTRTGAGEYSITIGQSLDANECILNVQSETEDVVAFVGHTSDTVKTVSGRATTGVGATAADIDFTFTAVQVAYGNK